MSETKNIYEEFDLLEMELKSGLQEDKDGVKLKALLRLKQFVNPIADTKYFIKIDKLKFIIAEYSKYSNIFDIEIRDKEFKLSEGFVIEDKEFKLNETCDEFKEVCLLNGVVSVDMSKVKTKEDYKKEVIKKIKKRQERDNQILNDDGDTGYFFKDILNINSDLTEPIQNFFNLFGLSIIEDYKKEGERLHDENSTTYKILKVAEENNIRFALCVNCYEYAIFFCSVNEMYNFIDENRVFEQKSYRHNFIFFDLGTELKDIHDYMKHYESDDDERLAVMIYKADIDTTLRKQRAKERLEELKGKRETELKTALSKTFKDNGEIQINGIKITKGFFEYDGFKVGNENFRIEEHVDFDNENLDFNNCFEYFCGILGRERNSESYFNKKEKIVVASMGKFEVKIEDRDNNYTYVNDIRINKGEIIKVLKRTICFNDVKDYNKLLSEVSKCSIRIHNAINNGIIIQYYSKYVGGYRYSSNQDNINVRIDDNINVRIDVKRKSGKHFIILSDTEEVGIKNINNLLALQERGSEQRDFNYITKVYLKSTNGKKEDVFFLISKGIENYKLAIKRSEEMLSQTIERLNIKRIKTTINGTEQEGYIVVGKSKKQYFVDDDLKVYDYPSMKYVCIVERSRSDGVGKDRLISRLYALSNDALMTEQISTLHTH